MDPSHPPAQDMKSKPEVTLRRMGMSLSVIGAIIFSEGLVLWGQRSGEGSDVHCVLILVSGIIMLGSGLYIWRVAKSLNQP